MENFAFPTVKLGYVLLATVIFTFIAWSLARNKKRQAKWDALTKKPIQDQIIEKIKSDVFEWSVENTRHTVPVLGWAIVSIGFLDGSVKYSPVVGWNTPYLSDGIQTKTLKQSSEDQYFLTEEGALRAIEEYIKRFKSKMPTSKVITLDSKNTKLQSPWLISLLILSEAMMNFFIEAKPYLIALVAIGLIATIVKLLRSAQEKALEIDDNEEYIFPDEEDFR